MTVKQLYCLGFLFAILILNSCSTQVVKGPLQKRVVKDPQQKLALLIANEDYIKGSDYGPLKNPIADAKRLAEALRKVGFTSFVYYDLPSKTEMEQAVEYFFGKARDNDILWFYYVGHGVQESGKNYLIPTQVGKTSIGELQEKTLTAQYVMDKMKERKGNGINIMVLDTCRGPLQTTEHDLTEVGGGNTVVVFSTASGQESPEDYPEGEPGKGSPLTRSLVAGIKQAPWQPLEDLLQEVGEAARKEYQKSNDYKDSWVYIYGWAGRRFCLSRCLNPQNLTITP